VTRSNWTSIGALLTEEDKMRTASNALYRAFCVVMALMLLFPAIALAEPNVPGEVTGVTITAPTTAAPAYVKAGGVVPVT
jgi:hypothetical protein